MLAVELETRQPVGMAMFFFFSNRLGCAGSLLLSLVATVLMLVLFGWIQLPGGGW